MMKEPRPISAEHKELDMDSQLTAFITEMDKSVPDGKVPGNRPEDLRITSDHPAFGLEDKGPAPKFSWWRKSGGNLEMSRERAPYQAQVIAKLGSEPSVEALVKLIKMINATAGSVSDGLGKAGVDAAKLNELQARLPYSDAQFVLSIALTAATEGEEAARRLAAVAQLGSD